MWPSATVATKATRAASRLARSSANHGHLRNCSATRHFAANATDSYFDRKAQRKQQRMQEYNDKQARKEQRKHRRDGKPLNVKKNKFLEWWLKRVGFEEKMDRMARRAKLDWKIQVSVVLERTPLILPDKEKWEQDLQDLELHLMQYGKQYPPELFGDSTSMLDEDDSDNKLYTDEELLSMLPEGLVPAPRVTEADKSGDVKTLDRKLQDFVFLTVQEDKEADWTFPTAELNEGENFYEASKRIMESTVGTDMDIYYVSNAPLAVEVSPYPEEDREKEGYFGVKTFFMKVQHDEGAVGDDVMPQHDFAWLNREEYVERIDLSAKGGDNRKNFFHYML